MPLKNVKKTSFFAKKLIANRKHYILLGLHLLSTEIVEK